MAFHHRTFDRFAVLLLALAAVAASMPAARAGEETSRDRINLPLDYRCDHGEGQACFEIGVLEYDEEGNLGPPDEAMLTEARSYFEKACKAGHAGGCFYLGRMNDKGEGGPKDDAKARELMASSCRGGVGRACFYLGLMDYNKNETTEDMVRARELFANACNLDFAGGCFNSGVMYEKGQGGPVDMTKAVSMGSQLSRFVGS